MSFFQIIGTFTSLVKCVCIFGKQVRNKAHTIDSSNRKTHSLKAEIDVLWYTGAVFITKGSRKHNASNGDNQYPDVNGAYENIGERKGATM